MKAIESSILAVVAEKPSVARDIARVLGAERRGEGYLQGNGYVVTWAIGHLVSLAQPHEMNPEWRQWRLDRLPILPERWPLVVYERTKDQFEVVRKILTSPRVSRIVCATDAGREGELIFRYIYEAAGSKKPVSRLWISSLTSEAIRKGFEKLRPGSEYDRLADAASGRSRADWLVGMNLSRAYSIVYREELSVGRVQTPTLAMVVDRELALRRFVSEDYIEVVATFQGRENPNKERYQGTWFRSQTGSSKDAQANMSRLPADGEEANSIILRAHAGEAVIESLSSETQRFQSPLLYDLTELQRHANRLFGFSAQQTLDTAQALYERHKLISYPRTDSRHLSGDVAATASSIVAAVSASYEKQLAAGTGERPLGKRYVDDSKVSDHHAIIPNAVSAEKVQLTGEERKIYDLICRRFLMMWHDDFLQAVTTVMTAITHEKIVDRYRTTGTVVEQMGWKVLDIGAEGRKRETKGSAEEKAPEQILPVTLSRGQLQDVVAIAALKKKTRPAKRFTEGTLLTAMQTAGQTLDEKELSEAMKETGLGTPATRAATIEVLLKRGYIVRTGKSLEATEKGIHLIEVVHPEVKSPAMTGQWEAFLKKIQFGEAELEPFLDGIGQYVRAVVGKVCQTPPVEPSSAVSTSPKTSDSSHLPIPAKVFNSTNLAELLQSAFGFSAFRPNQEAVCRAVMAGKDALLVMPTGSGKSLCYQLPGLARGGTTLVISPLIALMDDQVLKLKQLGFAVECIHSGRDRETSRRVCSDYLGGKLQFLFIAPERLRVGGFPEMLAKRKPSLIAIDEAHCISQWGHDFRPDYRMLGQYLPSLRPAPMLALTATATPLVQTDIATQLGLTEPTHFIHGFRRENIGIEIVEAVPSQRPPLVREILLDRNHRPAIVYTPTRKQAESLAEELAGELAVASYHAGLDAERRRRVQEEFMAGKLEVMVATTAFGMGIDKPDVRTVIHTGLPGSVEGYYQEIGRAGRDGKPSRAILMHSYGDRYTHDFFFGRDYPEVALLDRMFAKLHIEPQPKEALRKTLAIEEDVFDKALEKLWVHKGAVLDFAENVSRGEEMWRSSYILQGQQKKAQIDQMIRFAESNQCRMTSLVRHFGDTSDRAAACGVCDFCAPEKCVAQRFRTATEEERMALYRVLRDMHSVHTKSTGKLYAELYPGNEISRDNFEEVLGAMARAELLTFADAVFEKQGKQIPYRTVSLTAAGRTADQTTPMRFVMKDAVCPVPRRKRKKPPGKTTVSPRVTARTRSRQAGARVSEPKAEIRIEQALRAWRLSEAKRRDIPAFRIFSDRALRGIAATGPKNDAELLAVPGIGMSMVKQYGAQIHRLIKASS
ncbi:MAG: DNA topoisomerase 3 [Terriglobia bacterium]|nr:DNA topoisomerase 3 [Terriglobia bacterium]